MSPQHLESGQQAEQLALDGLLAAGLTLHIRNYRCPQGELDLVMLDGTGSVVIVEVRYRRDGNHGSAAETVAAAKQRKLTLATQHFLSQHVELRRKPLRFDVVAVSGAEGSDAVEWIQDAFQPG